MLFPIIIVLAICGAVAVNTPKPMYNVQEVAEWSKCDPAKVAFYIGTLQYEEQKDWLPAEVCLRLGEGDCKCFAQIAKEVLDRCAGYDNNIAILDPLIRPSYHAVTLFTDHKGNKGFINGSYYGYLDSWDDVRDISGGPWEIYQWKKK